MQGFGIRHTLNPNPYTGAFGNDGKKYAEDVQDVISTCTPGGVAGFIAETIQGVGGSVPLADGYLPAAYEVGARLCLSPSCTNAAPPAILLLLLIGQLDHSSVCKHIPCEKHAANPCKPGKCVENMSSAQVSGQFGFTMREP